MSQQSNESRKVAGATYTRAGSDYFEKRTLKRSAGVWGLWGLAVAAVIGVFLPLLGISLALFLIVDTIVGVARRRRTPRVTP